LTWPSLPIRMNAFGATLRAGLRGKLDCFADAHIGPAAADVAARVIGSAADLTDIEAETVFDIAGPMEAAFHKRLDPLLAGRTV
jgi:hypothetical protein